MSTYNEKKDSKPKSSNEVFIGKKPLMTYVIATLVQLVSEPTVFKKARGKSIPMAVDVAQIIVKRMNTLGYKVASVKIGSEAIKSEDGNTRNVSTIEGLFLQTALKLFYLFQTIVNRLLLLINKLQSL